MSRSSAIGLAALLGTQNPLGFALLGDIAANWNAVASETPPASPNGGDIWIEVIPVFQNPKRYVTALKNGSTTIDVLESSDAVTWTLAVTITGVSSNTSNAMVSVIRDVTTDSLIVMARSNSAMSENLMWIVNGSDRSIVSGPFPCLWVMRDTFFSTEGNKTAIFAWEYSSSPQYGFKFSMVKDGSIIVSSDYSGTVDALGMQSYNGAKCAWNPTTKRFATLVPGNNNIIELSEEGLHYTRGTYAFSGGSRGGMAYSPRLGLYIAFGRPDPRYSSNLTTWNAATAPLMGNYVQGFAWLPINDKFLARDAGGQVFESLNGTTYAKISTLGSQETTFLMEDSQGYIYHGSNDGMYRSMDGGITWTSLAISSYAQSPKTIVETVPGIRHKAHIFNGTAWEDLV